MLFGSSELFELNGSVESEIQGSFSGIPIKLVQGLIGLLPSEPHPDSVDDGENSYGPETSFVLSSFLGYQRVLNLSQKLRPLSLLLPVVVESDEILQCSIRELVKLMRSPVVKSSSSLGRHSLEDLSEMLEFDGGELLTLEFVERVVVSLPQFLPELLGDFDSVLSAGRVFLADGQIGDLELGFGPFSPTEELSHFLCESFLGEVFPSL